MIRVIFRIMEIKNELIERPQKVEMKKLDILASQWVFHYTDMILYIP